MSNYYISKENRCDWCQIPKTILPNVFLKNELFLRGINYISQCQYHTRCSSRQNSLLLYFFFLRHQRHLTAFTTWEWRREKIGRTGRTVFNKFENFGNRIRMIDHVTNHLQNLDLITRLATANRWSVDNKTRKKHNR